MREVPAEINRPLPGGILLIARDPGSTEVQQGKPLVGPAGQLLDQALAQAGIRRSDINLGNCVNVQPAENDFRRHAPEDVARGREQLDALIQKLRPNIIIAAGNEAAFSTVPDWPSTDGTIFGAAGIQERRGYLWEGHHSCKVLTTLHPAACLIHRDPSGINAMLLTADLERARHESRSGSLSRTPRSVRIIHRAAEAPILAGRTVACDIECSDANTLLCIGFAVSATEAYVFVGEALGAAFVALRDPTVRKVFQNGAFDTYFLKTRCDIKVISYTDDCMLAWHALWPEIAGKGEKKKSKQTRKSLAFLISLYCESPEWHKNYDVDEVGLYQLCGIDCCTTLEIIQKQLVELEEQDVMAIYRHEMAMQPVLTAIQERGLLIDDARRREVLNTLAARAQESESRMRELAEPILHSRKDRLDKQHLFFGKKRCPCCNGGKVARMACWSCAGLAGTPRNKKSPGLGPCRVCAGAGKLETFEFNPASGEQKAELFYNCLGLDKRYKDGKVTVDEKALKASLANL